jgi:hypothetical protein
MAERPFELLRRDLMDGGMRLVFKCGACDGEVGLVILDGDPLTEKFPVECSCGIVSKLYFGSPLVGRALLRKLRRQPDPVERHHRCSSPLLN